MRARVWAAVGGLVMLFVAAMPAAAIIDGEPDGNAHPYVGVVPFSMSRATTCTAVAAP